MKDETDFRHYVINQKISSASPDFGTGTAGGAVNKDKSEPHHRVIRFGFLLPPPDGWRRQLAAGAGDRT